MTSSKTFVFLISVCFITPIVVTLFSILAPFDAEMQHLSSTVLPEYIRNTLWLMLGVGFLTFLIGTTTAWLTSIYTFTGQNFFSWGMFLPLAFPTYVVAFIYAGLLEYAGPLQHFIRDFFNLSRGGYTFFEIRSLGGAIVLMSIVLYPYVYMLSRISFMRIGDGIHVGQSLGLSMFSIFRKIALPSARPAIAAGMALACMEALSDFGAVQYLAVDTFTTGIYRSWFGMYNLDAATKLAAFLMLFIFALIFVERLSRGKSRYYDINSSKKHIDRIKLKGWKNIAAFVICAIPITIGFVIPVLWLIINAIKTYKHVVDERFISLIWHSLQISSIAMISAVFIAIIFAYILRFNSTRITKTMIRISSIGYAIPGSVAAVSILICAAFLDKQLDKYFETGLLLSGTLFALAFAYTFRFLAIALGGIESGMMKITREIHWSARILSSSKSEMMRRVHAPMISKSIIVACLLVFVECIKELPVTTIVRPFNFDTLAIRTYEFASDERLADSSCSALMIVFLGVIPVFLLSKAFRTAT